MTICFHAREECHHSNILNRKVLPNKDYSIELEVKGFYLDGFEGVNFGCNLRL